MFACSLSATQKTNANWDVDPECDGHEGYFAAIQSKKTKNMEQRTRTNEEQKDKCLPVCLPALGRLRTPPSHHHTGPASPSVSWKTLCAHGRGRCANMRNAGADAHAHHHLYAAPGASLGPAPAPISSRLPYAPRTLPVANGPNTSSRTHPRNMK
jgi:hypothetical protein